MMERSMETETIISEFTKGRKAIVAQILVSEKINANKQDRESQFGIRVGKVNHLIKVI